MRNKSLSKPSFFLWIAIVGLLAALIGFSKTFFIPMSNGSFKAPIIIHIHGAFAFAWILLFLTQTSLIHYRKYSLHQTLGFLGFFIATGVLVTLIPTSLHVVQRDLKQGLGEMSYSSLLGVIISGMLFFVLVVSGILKRKSPATHKRLMLLSTIVVLWPAWFRFRHFFPSIPNPEIWFALVLSDSLIIFSWIWDKMKNGFIHPVLKYVGLFIIVEQTIEVIMFDSPLWRSASKWIYHLFT